MQNIEINRAKYSVYLPFLIDFGQSHIMLLFELLKFFFNLLFILTQVFLFFTTRIKCSTFLKLRFETLISHFNIWRCCNSSSMIFFSDICVSLWLKSERIGLTRLERVSQLYSGFILVLFLAPGTSTALDRRTQTRSP